MDYQAYTYSAIDEIRRRHGLEDDDEARRKLEREWAREDPLIRILVDEKEAKKWTHFYIEGGGHVIDYVQGYTDLKTVLMARYLVRSRSRSVSKV